MRIAEDRITVPRTGPVACVCLVAVTCAGTVHRVCFPHAAALQPAQGPRPGADVDVMPSIFTRFADGDAGSAPPLQLVRSDGGDGDTDMLSGGSPGAGEGTRRTSCIRAEYVALALRKGAAASCAAWLDADTVAVGSTSGAVEVVQLNPVSQPGAAGGAPAPVRARYELFNAGLVSKLWGGLVGASNAGAVVGIAAAVSSVTQDQYVIVAHSDRRVSVWHCQSRTALLDAPLVEVAGAAAGAASGADDEAVVGATVVATSVEGARGSPGRAVVALQLVCAGGGGADPATRGRPGAAVLLDCRLSPDAARLTVRRGCGTCFAEGELSATPAVAADMQRMVSAWQFFGATWCLWRGAGGGPGVVGKHCEVAPAVSTRAAAGSRVVLPLRVEQARMKQADARGTEGSLEFGLGLRDEEKFHVSRVFKRDRFSSAAVGLALAEYVSDTGGGVDPAASADLRRRFLHSSSQRRQQIVIEAVRARMEVELAPEREAMELDGSSDDESGDEAGAGSGDGPVSAARRRRRERELAIARAAWRDFLAECERAWEGEQVPLALIGAGNGPSSVPLVVRRSGLSILRSVDDVEAVALDIATAFTPIRYDAPVADKIDVSSLFTGAARGSPSREESKGSEGGAR